MAFSLVGYGYGEDDEDEEEVQHNPSEIAAHRNPAEGILTLGNYGSDSEDEEKQNVEEKARLKRPQLVLIAFSTFPSHPQPYELDPLLRSQTFPRDTDSTANSPGAGTCHFFGLSCLLGDANSLPAPPPFKKPRVDYSTWKSEFSEIFEVPREVIAPSASLIVPDIHCATTSTFSFVLSLYL